MPIHRRLPKRGFTNINKVNYTELNLDKIQKLIDSNPLMVFMKGTKLMPQCGFSNNVVQILNSLGVKFKDQYFLY